MARIDSMGIDTRRLRYFVAVCDHGGFSRAAGMIGIAQPALTRQIQLFEQELGIELFTRNGRSAVPSAAGQFLLAGARGHLDALDQLIGRVRRDFAASPMRVNFGICPTIAPLFLDHLSEVLRAAAGGPIISVIEAYSGDLRRLMQAGELDLALSYPPAAETGVRATPLLSERLVLACCTRSLPEPVTLRDLLRLKLVLPGRLHQLRRIIDALCAERGLALEPALELDSLAAVKALLADETGDYATILPYHSVAPEAARGRFALHFVDDPGMVRTIALLQPDRPSPRLPAGLAERIVSRADEIRNTLEAVT